MCPTWTVAFDSTFAVFDIEAQTKKEAETKAQKAIEKIRGAINECTESYGLWINSVYLVRNEDTGEEILK